MHSLTITLTALLSLSPLALAGVISPRQQSDAVGVTRTGQITYYNTLGGTGSCGTALSDNEAIVAVSTELYDQCKHLLSFSFVPSLPPPPSSCPLFFFAPPRPLLPTPCPSLAAL